MEGADFVSSIIPRRAYSPKELSIKPGRVEYRKLCFLPSLLIAAHAGGQVFQAGMVAHGKDAAPEVSAAGHRIYPGRMMSYIFLFTVFNGLRHFVEVLFAATAFCLKYVVSIFRN